MKNILQNKKIIVFILMIFLVFAAILWYVNDIYHSNDSIKGYLKGKDFITVTEISDGLYLRWAGRRYGDDFLSGCEGGRYSLPSTVE